MGSAKIRNLRGFFWDDFPNGLSDQSQSQKQSATKGDFAELVMNDFKHLKGILVQFLIFAHEVSGGGAVS